jgi:hypothetical protein
MLEVGQQVCGSSLELDILFFFDGVHFSGSVS